MPELAEVEFFRRVWMRAATVPVLEVQLHSKARPLREVDHEALLQGLTCSVLESSSASGKRMCFKFSGNQWLGVHLGMTGELRVEASGFIPLKHDHLVLHLAKSSLIFTDPRMFGRIQYASGADAPPWWRDLPPDLLSPKFNEAWVNDFLLRHQGLPLKAAVLLQDGFAGVGNWMADEILWRAHLHPQRKVGTLTDAEMATIHAETVAVAREALRTVVVEEGATFAEPPQGWLFHTRWGKVGLCPRDGLKLRRETVGGRTTAWCDACQPMKNKRV